ncbi:hypothetical protein O3P69_000201 [Scylla paramamosain]|uniref:Uncharacterized protein n=1 Tax=Scylla paramamosain TaxID=85552 RepID=A0AAW0UZF7_SCYPA
MILPRTKDGTHQHGNPAKDEATPCIFFKSLFLFPKQWVTASDLTRQLFGSRPAPVPCRKTQPCRVNGNRPGWGFKPRSFGIQVHHYTTAPLFFLRHL